MCPASRASALKIYHMKVILKEYIKTAHLLVRVQLKEKWEHVSFGSSVRQTVLRVSVFSSITDRKDATDRGVFCFVTISLRVNSLLVWKI